MTACGCCKDLEGVYCALSVFAIRQQHLTMGGGRFAYAVEVTALIFDIQYLQDPNAQMHMSCFACS